MHPGIHAKSNPDRTAYVMSATGRAITYRELDEESNRAANLFRSLGLRSGEGIALFPENNIRYHQNLGTPHRSEIYYTPIIQRLPPPNSPNTVNHYTSTHFITY